MAKKRKRFLYLKADFRIDGEKTLESYLRKAYKELPTADERIFSLADKEAKGTYFLDEKGTFIVQYTVYTPGEEATTVPINTKGAYTADLQTMPAAQNQEFSDGDAILLVSGDNIFAVFSRLRDTTVSAFLRALFTEAELEERACEVDIVRPANIDKMRIIANEGVKSIEINATLDGVDFSKLENARGKGFLKKLWRALVWEDKDLAKSALDAKAKFKVFLDRGKVTGEKNTDWLKGEAEDTLSATDSYKITTNNGKVIKNNEILISKYANMEPFGKSVFIDEAILKLKAFKDEFLKTS